MYKRMRLLLVGVLVLALLGAVAVGCGDDEPTTTSGGGTATTGAAGPKLRITKPDRKSRWACSSTSPARAVTSNRPASRRLP